MQGCLSAAIIRTGAVRSPATAPTGARPRGAAHHLRNDVIEDLKLLTNFDMDSAPRLCLLLIGLTELRRRLSMAVHESLYRRLIVQHHLHGLLHRYRVCPPATLQFFFIYLAESRNLTPNVNTTNKSCHHCTHNKLLFIHFYIFTPNSFYDRSHVFRNV